MRYPLIDFHGNKGNVIGDGPAAPRYTEGRLSKLAEDGMLAGLKKKNVEFTSNYDETEEEPITLPAIFPNLLCNPNTGIGVAMACNWLPHNLNEVASAIYDYMDGNEPMLPGPDFPTGGVVINAKDVPTIMKTGHGSIKVRGKYNIEKQKIIFYEIPYGVSVESILNSIGEACDKKELEGIEEVKDESDKKGLRIVIECEKGVNPAALINKIFKKTYLQTSISYNQVAIVNSTPTELNLKDAIKIYLEHNIDCLIKELNFDLDKAKARLHIVNGLLIALEDIDNVITLIKKSENSEVARTNLMTKYNLSESQAKAILAMRLSSLAHLEKLKLENEKKELENEIERIEDILGSEELQKKEIKARLAEICKKYGDKRRTELTDIVVPKEEKEIEEVVPEDVVVIMTQAGMIKRVPKSSFKTQRRNGKGVKTADDAILDTISTNTIDNLLLFSSKGKMYKLLVDNIPVGTNASKGTDIGSLIKIEPSESIVAITSLNRKTDAQYVVFFTKKGLIKKTNIEEYTKVKKTTGIIAIKLAEDDSLANVTFIKDENMVVITKKGMAIHFPTTSINPIGKVAAGVRAIKLNENDEVLIGLPIKENENHLAIVTKIGNGKKIKLNDIPIQLRGGKGVIINKDNDEIAGAAIVNNMDILLLLGKPNSICVSTTELPEVSRISTGNLMIKNSNIMRMFKI